MFGGNKSAEDPQEDDCAAAGVTGCNIVIQNRLMEQVGVDKKGYKKYIKLYIAALVKRVEQERPAELASFKAKVSKAVARILESFDDWQFFHGEKDFDFDNKEKAEGMLAIMGYRDEYGKMPYMLFFKDGLEEEKAVSFAHFVHTTKSVSTSLLAYQAGTDSTQVSIA